MPVRRMPVRLSHRVFGTGWFMAGSHPGRQPRQDGFPGKDLVAHRGLRLGLEGKIHFHAGTEAEETEALSLLQAVPGMHVTLEAAREQPRHLHTGYFRSAVGMNPQCIALVLERRLVERGVQEAAAEIRSEEHTSELQSLTNLVCRLLLEKKKDQLCNAHI